MTREELAKQLLENLANGNAHADEYDRAKHQQHCRVTPNSCWLSDEEHEAAKAMSPEERAEFLRKRQG